MKIAGEKLSGPNVETIVIPRGDGRNPVIFKAQAVLNYEQFDRLCPTPTPPIKMLRGGEKQEDLNDPAYKQRMVEYATKKMAWITLKSLEATEGLEWERVDLGNPNTWGNYEKELEESGFSPVEIGRIRTGVFIANCLDDSKIEEARQSFLAGLLKPAEVQLSQKVEPNGTPSGEPANVSESVLQE